MGFWRLLFPRGKQARLLRLALCLGMLILFIFLLATNFGHHLSWKRWPWKLLTKRSKHRAARGRFEQDPMSLIRRLPADPLLAGSAVKGALPKTLHNLRASTITGPMLITAPHGIPLWRGERLKGGEPGTTNVAWRSAFTDPLRGYATALTWKDTSTLHELSKTKTTVFLDPNYLLPEETALEPWSIVLRAHYRAHGDDAVLVDIHGMADTHGSDCTVGIAPWMSRQPKDATQCQQCIHNGLSRIFPGLRFKQLPYFTGDWEDRKSSKYTGANDGRMTLSKQAVHLGMRAVQLEMTMTLRNAILGYNSSSFEAAKLAHQPNMGLGMLEQFSDMLRTCVLRLPSALQRNKPGVSPAGGG